MVLGFIIFWPLGLAMLAWIIWGEKVADRMRDAEVRWRSEKTGNHAFDDYRKAEIERLEEERRRLDAEREEFETYLRDLKRARDQEEFDRYMAERRAGQTAAAPKTSGADDAPESGSAQPA
ncbi:MAG: DUF2852 domain-containing protein [Pseudomonadota bacterium]